MSEPLASTAELDRFMRNVDIVPGSCWEWRGKPNNMGYGRIYCRGAREYAHRAAWIIFEGAIPEGVVVCHKCDNPLCVRTSHLFLGTQFDNLADMTRKGRRSMRRGADNMNARLTEQDVREIRASTEPHSVLAARYGIQTNQHIKRIQEREVWTHVE
jgi:hypothetical protein